VNGVVTGQLSALHRAFDESFAVLPPPKSEDLESILLIRAGGEPVVLRSLAIDGLAKSGRVLPVPGRVPELMGITGIRAALAPVFSLAALLGFASGRAECRWLALTRGETPLALAFDAIEGQIVLPRADFHDCRDSSSREHIKQLVRIDSTLWPVADVAAIVETIRGRAGLIDADKE
jgi:purine-binding chemotaxis protein CheW